MASPCLRGVETVERHVSLDRLGGTIVIPELEASLDVLEGLLPLSLNVALESLSEYGVELCDVLLESDDVTVEREHVVYAFVLETFDVDCFILCQLNEVSH